MNNRNKRFLVFVIIIILIVGAFSLFNNSYNNKLSNMANLQNSNIQITPIQHATMVLRWGDKIIYTDPVGGAKAFTGEPAPDIILLSHAHSDHFDVDTLKAVSKDKTIIIAPMTVADQMPATIPGTLLVMKNGQKATERGMSVEAIPMYNVPESATAYHVKGDSNGYVLGAGGKRVYVSGDTGNTPELRNLKNIDIAFVSMNLPYTMTVEDAASGVLAFKPKQIYPYHYKGTDGLSDLNKFKQLVNAGNQNIEVVLLDWYPPQK